MCTQMLQKASIRGTLQCPLPRNPCKGSDPSSVLRPLYLNRFLLNAFVSFALQCKIRWGTMEIASESFLRLPFLFLFKLTLLISLIFLVYKVLFFFGRFLIKKLCSYIGKYFSIEDMLFEVNQVSLNMYYNL